MSTSGLKVLLIAPHPFFRERGTPIAVYLLARTLCEAGHKVDLLTYHEGSDVVVPGLTIYRIPDLPFIKNVPIGFSLKKLVCDIFVFFSLIRRLFSARYDVIHAVEEAIFLVLPLRLFSRACVVYDMDSSIADQLVESRPGLRMFSGLFNWFEGVAVKRADLIFAVCDYLAEKARSYDPGKCIVTLEDMPLEPSDDQGEIDDFRRFCGPGKSLALYVGNLEKYQGIDLLLEAVALLKEPERLLLVIIGGNRESIDRYERKAASLGIARHVRFAGPRPIGDLYAYLDQADILLSPRLTGNNTPMKIYSYMASGKPLIATDIPSHAQVLDASTAVLTSPDAAEFAAGLDRLLEDEPLRMRLGAAARQLVETRYSLENFRKKLISGYRSLESLHARETPPD